MGLRSLFFALLAFPWFVHGSVVWLSAIGARPLAERTVSLAILVLGLAFALAAARSGASRRAVVPDELPRWGTCGVLRLLALGGAFAFAAGCTLSIVLPIVAYDALAYRLPVIAQWLDAGRISWVATDDPVRNGYPLGQEAVSAVVARAVDSMQLADLTSFLYVAAGATAVWLLAESCGVRRAFARAAAAVFVLVPMTILNAGSGYVDAAFGGATVAFLCSAASLLSTTERRPENAAALGMAAAHVLALKGTGLGFVPLVACGLLVARRLGRRAAPLRSELALAALFALPGAFWVLRDLIHTGNPLWPVEIRLAGRTLLSGTGVMDDILDVKHNTPAELAGLSGIARVARTWLQWRGPALVFDDRRAGLGWAWPLCALPAIGSFVWQRTRGLRGRRGAAELSFVLVLTVACFALQPMSWWSRYTIWLWGIGALALAFEAERLIALRRVRTLTGFAILLTCLCLGEGAVALSHANGALVAIRRWGRERQQGLQAFLDPRLARNAVYWVPDEFWRMGIDAQPEICRGAWKPDTDDAILDGVFAQLTLRPRVHILFDQDGDWSRVRHAWLAAGCGDLLLLKGSPVLAPAMRDPSVSVERARAFDPFFVVRLSEA